MKEVPYRDTDVRNGTQHSVNFKHSGQLNIFFASILFSRNQKLYVVDLNVTHSHSFSSPTDYQRSLQDIKKLYGDQITVRTKVERFPQLYSKTFSLQRVRSSPQTMTFIQGVPVVISTRKQRSGVEVNGTATCSVVVMKVWRCIST